MPKDQVSTLLSYNFLRSNYGDIYRGVPQKVSLISWDSIDQPKSQIFIIPYIIKYDLQIDIECFMVLNLDELYCFHEDNLIPGKSV